VAIVLAWGVAGCAHGVAKVAVSPRLDLPAGQRIGIVGASRSDANAGEVDALAFAVARRLRESGRFAEVEVRREGDAAIDDVILLCEVTDIKRVTSEMRVMLGALVGRGWIRTHVRLRRHGSSTVLADADVEGFSSGGSVFAGTTGQAIEEAAKTIADFVLQKAV
jgi:hypothetical protein